MNRRGGHTIAVVGLAALLGARPAAAKATAEMAWPFEQVLSAAVRFVRVDRGCKITDKDEHAAYLMFECADLGHKAAQRGPLELFKGERVVRVQLTLADQPRYMELRFLELLERKLRDERGMPLPPRQPPPPPPPPDGGA